MTRTAKSALTIYDVSDGDTPSFVRYYSTNPGLLSEMGDPTTPGSGVTWTLASGAVPNTAYWIAERYTIAGGTPSAWQLMPVQAKDGGIPFVTGDQLGTTKPTLGDSTWITHAVAAVSAFTGRTYSSQKEFGYGTTVVITYSNGKLSGRYARVSGVDGWVAPASFIDGNLIVDGSIAAAQIAANTITADEIDAGAITASKLVIVGTGAVTPGYLGAATTAANEAAAKTANWSTVTDDNSAMPADNATVGATWGTDVTGQPSDARLFGNLLDSESWVVGSSGSQTGFSQNGSTAENSIILGLGPKGETKPLWQGNSISGGADGGWNSSTIPIDHTKSYRQSVWIKRSHATDGSSYLGCYGGSTNNMSGTSNTNPYHFNGDLPSANKWYLVVGIINGSGYSSSGTGVSGVYDPDTGVKVLSGSDFKNKTTATVQQQRAYLYYSATDGNQAWFTDPRFELIDSNTPSIISLMNADAVTNKVITDNIYTAGTTTIEGGQITAGSINVAQVNLVGATGVNATTIGADPSGTGLAITSNIYSAGTTYINGGQIDAGTVTADKLILNNNALEVEGNNLTIAGSALNRTHRFHVGTTVVIAVPYLATEMVITGSAAGGGRPSMYVAAVERQQGFATAGGGGAACWNLPIAIPAGHTHLQISCGAGVSGAAGGSTTVKSGPSSSGPFTTSLALGGGGVSYHAVNTYPTSNVTVAGASGGTVSTGYSIGFSYHGQSTSSGLVRGNQTNMSWGKSGGQAGLGPGSTLTDWPFGQATTTGITYSDSREDYWRWRGNSNWSDPVGFGCGSPGANGGAYQGSGNQTSITIPASAGGDGFLIISFGA